jgi:hypothetical protein
MTIMTRSNGHARVVTDVECHIWIALQQLDRAIRSAGLDPSVYASETLLHWCRMGWSPEKILAEILSHRRDA